MARADQRPSTLVFASQRHRVLFRITVAMRLTATQRSSKDIPTIFMISEVAQRCPNPGFFIS